MIEATHLHYRPQLGELATDSTLRSLMTADEKLPTLAKTLATYRQATIVQYWPGRRCTMRIEGLGGPQFAKVYPKKFLRGDRGAKIHDVGVALWEASARGDVAFKVPKAIAWDAASLTLKMERLAGIPAVTNLTGPNALLQASRIGRAAASITLVKIEPFRTFDYSEQLKDSADCAQELVRRAAHLGESIDELLTRLKRGARATEKRPLVPIHGDMHIGQWLDNAGELGLLDFDDFALGHPERDAAFFMVQLEEECPRLMGTHLLNAAFLAGYESVTGKLNKKLLRLYRAHKWLAKALRSARELRSDGDVQAGQNLRRALSCSESSL